MWKRRLSRIKFSINYRLIAKVAASVVIAFGIVFVGGVVFLKSLIDSKFSANIYTDVSKLPAERIAIVFGAGLNSDKTGPNKLLDDRLFTVAQLYKAGKVNRVILSGSNPSLDYNEPKIMIETAVKYGIKEFDLQPDYKGNGAFETCYRAKAIFGVNKAILIAQKHDLPRILYLCNSLGIEVDGYSADQSDYADSASLVFNAYFTNFTAFWQLNVSQPEVVLGDKIPI